MYSRTETITKGRGDSVPCSVSILVEVAVASTRRDSILARWFLLRSSSSGVQSCHQFFQQLTVMLRLAIETVVATKNPDSYCAQAIKNGIWTNFFYKSYLKSDDSLQLKIICLFVNFSDNMWWSLISVMSIHYPIPAFLALPALQPEQMALPPPPQTYTHFCLRVECIL